MFIETEGNDLNNNSKKSNGGHAMKKIIAAALAATMTLGLCTGCGGGSQTAATSAGTSETQEASASQD